MRCALGVYMYTKHSIIVCDHIILMACVDWKCVYVLFWVFNRSLDATTVWMHDLLRFWVAINTVSSRLSVCVHDFLLAIMPSTAYWWFFERRWWWACRFTFYSLIYIMQPQLLFVKSIYFSFTLSTAAATAACVWLLLLPKKAYGKVIDTKRFI